MTLYEIDLIRKINMIAVKTRFKAMTWHRHCHSHARRHDRYMSITIHFVFAFKIILVF